MRNKNVVLGVAVVAVLAVMLSVGATMREAKPEPTPTPTAFAVVEAPLRFITVEVAEGKTALIGLKEQYTVETETYSFGEMITSINGLAATDTEGWAFYVNGQMAAVGAGDYVVQTGDKIEFRYEAF